MSILDQALSGVRAVAPYLPGKPITELAREMGVPVESIVKLASNENPLGMSPKAQAAVMASISGIARYPDDYSLKKMLAEHTGLSQGRIVLGNGSNDVLDMVARVFLAPGCSAVMSQYAFAVYPIVTLLVGAEVVEVPARNFGHDLAAMQAAIRPDTRLAWIANPNNPTGTFISAAAIRAFLQAVPSEMVVVLDEAYNEYISPDERFDSLSWLDEFPNLVITRTFSKIYGLAGLRVGYALTSEGIADLMNRVRQPFNCNNLALTAACAALDDHLFVARSYELNRRGLAQILEGLKQLALAHIPSHGNFIAFEVEKAMEINQRLLKKGVIVRPLGNYGMHQHLRVTIGTEAENARFLDALASAINE